MNKLTVLGFLIVFLGAVAVLAAVNRFTVTQDTGNGALKMDRWTGETWMQRYTEDPKGYRKFYWVPMPTLY